MKLRVNERHVLGRGSFQGNKKFKLKRGSQSNIEILIGNAIVREEEKKGWADEKEGKV